MKQASLWAVVPVKSFAFAKQRLMPLLDRHERAALAKAMLEDVLSALVRSPYLAGTLVVTNDAEATAIALHAGADVLSDLPDDGLVAAVRHAVGRLALGQRAGMLVVPADVPLIQGADVELISLRHRSSPAVTLVAAGSDGGTNALACSPPDAMPICFGDDSFRRHVGAALALGLRPTVLTLPRFARDIDRPEDLLAFIARPSATRACAYLTASGIARRLARHAPTHAGARRSRPAHADSPRGVTAAL
jgi:2-phospho-L-lactate guanylyltransferase